MSCVLLWLLNCYGITSYSAHIIIVLSQIDAFIMQWLNNFNLYIRLVICYLLSWFSINVLEIIKCMYEMILGTLVTCFQTCITCSRYVQDLLLQGLSRHACTYQYLSQEYNPDILPLLEPRGEPGKDGPAHHEGTCCPRGVDVVLVHSPALQKKNHNNDSISYPPIKKYMMTLYLIFWCYKFIEEVAGSWRYDSMSLWLGLFPYFLVYKHIQYWNLIDHQIYVKF